MAIFDLALSPQNTIADQQYALIIIIADQDATGDLLKLLNNGTTQSLYSHTGVKRENINWIDDFQIDLEDLKDDFTVHETINFTGERDQTVIYN